jgi:hypothetical protein
MKTFKQILSEAKEPRAKPKPKTPKNDYTDVDTFKNHRGLEGGIIHVRGEIKPDERAMFNERLKKHMMNYISKPGGPMSSESHAGVWLASNGHASFFEHGKASHGYVRDKTVAANDKNAIPGIVKTVRGKTTFHYTGNESLTPELEQRILNHEGMNHAFGTDFTVAKDR